MLVCVAAFSGCVRAAPDFVQGNTRITPPVICKSVGQIHDGGSLLVRICDAKRREFWIFIDHSLESTNTGAIYLDSGPEKYPPSRVRVINEQEFKQKVRDFEHAGIRTNGLSQ